MGTTKYFVLFLLALLATDVSSHYHRHHGYYPKHRQENVDFVEREADVGSENVADVRTESPEKNQKHSETLDNVGALPFSARRLERMLEKAILKIITGDLGTAEMLLLKSLNYTPEEVHAIRQREFERKRKNEELKKRTESGRRFYNKNMYGNKAKDWNYNSMEFESTSRNDPDIDIATNEKKKNRYEDFDFDAYNRQAVIDYEDLASKLDLQHSWSKTGNLDYEDESRNSGEWNSMEPHVIFKIPYDDSEFDSGSDERPSKVRPKHRTPSTLRHTTAKNVANSFHASSLSSSSSSSSSSASSTATGYSPLPVVYQLGKGARSDYTRNERSFSTTETPEPVDTGDSTATSSTTDNTVSRKTSEYEGLEWVEDDVYRVIPEFQDSQIHADESETSDYEEQKPDETDTLEYYQNDAPDSVRLFDANVNVSENASQTNLSVYQQTALAHRREENITSSFDSQGQKAIEDIKTRVLAMTGRFNHSTSANQVQRERLTMYLPTCQIPRNTDPEAWTDPFSMNMHFQLNLTSVDHVVAAKLRIYKLPQDNVTSSADGGFDEDENDEKKIRISVYYYTKSLKKHRSKKRLMDSVVTPLAAKGTHLALDIRQCLRFWQQTPRNSHGNSSNHGLVIQIEDQDGRPLKPAEYIQQPSCEDHDVNQKFDTYLHFSSEPALLTFAS